MSTLPHNITTLDGFYTILYYGIMVDWFGAQKNIGYGTLMMNGYSRVLLYIIIAPPWCV
jgi:hypothetical protein